MRQSCSLAAPSWGPLSRLPDAVGRARECPFGRAVLVLVLGRRERSMNAYPWVAKTPVYRAWQV